MSPAISDHQRPLEAGSSAVRVRRHRRFGLARAVHAALARYRLEALERRVLLAYPAPTAVDLLAASDTGVSSTDNITNLDNSSATKRLSFLVSGTVSGTTVSVYASGTLIGSATSAAGSTTVQSNGSVDIPDGPRSITARQGDSGSSPTLPVTIDTIAPPIYSDGTLDTSFGGGDGVVTTPIGTSLDAANAIVLQPDGKILVAGNARIGHQA
jgi:hypothetical protein